MTSIGQKTRVTDWLLFLVGPSSGVLTFLVAAVRGSGADAGWIAMTALFKGMGVIVLLHVLAIAIVIVVAIRRYLRRSPSGNVLLAALTYYGIVILIALVASGPTELLRDSIAALRAAGK